METENILEHVQEVAPYFQQRLQSFAELPIVVDVRGMGLMGCIECEVDAGGADRLSVDYDLGNRIDKHCQALGLLVRPIINMWCSHRL